MVTNRFSGLAGLEFRALPQNPAFRSQRSGQTTTSVPRDDNESVIDTSRMSEGERAALEVTEAAREAASMERTFAGGLFLGSYDFSQVAPFPEQSFEDRDQGDAFLSRLGEFLRNNTNPDEIDESGEIPDQVIDGLAKLGAFGIKIPTKYGGLGLSQTNYCRAASDAREAGAAT